MNINQEEFLRILHKYQAGQATEEEIRFLHAYYNLLGAIPQGEERVGKAEGLERKAQVKARLMARLAAPESRALSQGKFFRPWMAAAVLLVLLGGGLYCWLATLASPAFRQPLATPPIPGGGNRATLTLAGGATISLDETRNGLLSRQGMAAIRKTRDGQLVYTADRQQPAAPGKQPLLNTLETPRGGQYQVTLADGTRVWLNAATTLKFPAAFSGPSRMVELSGEAYFEVAHRDGQPFIVKVPETEIRVLGTHFNVMAYPEEVEVQTTLLQGAVLVSRGADSRRLAPGQQARTGARGMEVLAQADTEAAVAWKNGYFKFHRADIQTIMRQVARWYNVEVAYSGPVPQGDFVGQISRTENLAGLLRILELSGIRYRMEKRKIIILQEETAPTSR